jgi:hypothetical protein
MPSFSLSVITFPLRLSLHQDEISRAFGSQNRVFQSVWVDIGFRLVSIGGMKTSMLKNQEAHSRLATHAPPDLIGVISTDSFGYHEYAPRWQPTKILISLAN